MTSHIDTPAVLKAIYLNLATGQDPARMAEIRAMLQRTSLNALFIDVRSSGAHLLRASDEETGELLSALHDEGVYVAARVVAFKGERAGRWFDPGDRARWRQIAETSVRAVDLGFDEINYDYVRYGAANEPRSSTPVPDRAPTIRAFAAFLRREVRSATGHPISVDIFGVTLLGPQAVIGQRLADAAEHFDYVMPMPYPSHWPPGAFGLSNPAHHPYQAVHDPLSRGAREMAGDPKTIAKLRTWVQAFDLDSSRPMRRYVYTPSHIREQIRACHDAGGVGFCAWNAGNAYREEAFTESA